jgi:hypothetical protein
MNISFVPSSLRPFVPFVPSSLPSFLPLLQELLRVPLDARRTRDINFQFINTSVSSVLVDQKKKV